METRSFKLSEFEGPLDLLWQLIRKNEVNIFDIPISEITEQYIESLNNIEILDLEELTAFHTMATSLLYIKSRTLLPVEMDDFYEDPRAELVDRLIEYQKFKKLSELMEEKEKDNEWILERRRLQYNLPFTDDDIWQKVDIWDLVKTFSSLTVNMSAERIIDLYEEVSVNEKTTLLAEFLENKGECRFTELIIRPGAMDIVCAFLAVLEAAKMRMIVLFQNRLFGDILIRAAGSI
ncbi:MAG: segregation/condensation protein A [Treponema sp.]|nr:segregation/condensation protein A [Treponema sp.]